MNFFLVKELDVKNHKMATVVSFVFGLIIGCWFYFTIYLVGDVQYSSSLKCKSEIKGQVQTEPGVQTVFEAGPQTGSVAHVSFETMIYAILPPKMTSLVTSWFFRGLETTVYYFTTQGEINNRL